MNPLLRKWLDEKNLEFNHDGYSQETLNALKEFANYVAAQQSVQATDALDCTCPKNSLGFVLVKAHDCPEHSTALSKGDKHE